MTFRSLDRSSMLSATADLAGAIPARHRVSSANRFPIPAMRCWSRSTAFTEASDVNTDRNRSAEIESASGPSRDSSGSSSTPPRRRGSRSTMDPPSAKRRPNRSHELRSRSLEYSNRSIAADPSTSKRPVIPNRNPSTAPVERSPSRSFPIRRTFVISTSIRALRSCSGVVAPLQNQVSLASTSTIRRRHARSAIRRYASTSIISGTKRMYRHRPSIQQGPAGVTWKSGVTSQSRGHMQKRGVTTKVRSLCR